MTRAPLDRLYHRRPPDFRGGVLYPLNALRAVAADLYERQRGKYAGREHLLGQRVPPPLDCLWNDVLHFSPVHPARVAELARDCGLVWHEADWFEIDPVAAGFTPANTAVFRYADTEREGPIPDAEFEPFDAARLAGMSELPASTRAYYRSVPPGSSRYFIFVGVPHVLHRGPVDVTRAPLVRA
jgi:hypothetical protein